MSKCSIHIPTTIHHLLITSLPAIRPAQMRMRKQGIGMGVPRGAQKAERTSRTPSPQHHFGHGTDGNGVAHTPTPRKVRTRWHPNTTVRLATRAPQLPLSPSPSTLPTVSLAHNSSQMHVNERGGKGDRDEKGNEGRKRPHRPHTLALHPHASTCPLTPRTHPHTLALFHTPHIHPSLSLTPTSSLALLLSRTHAFCYAHEVLGLPLTCPT